MCYSWRSATWRVSLHLRSEAQCVLWTCSFSFNPLTAVALPELWVKSKTLLCKLAENEVSSYPSTRAEESTVRKAGSQVSDWTSNASQHTAISHRRLWGGCPQIFGLCLIWGTPPLVWIAFAQLQLSPTIMLLSFPPAEGTQLLLSAFTAQMSEPRERDGERTH